MQGHPEKVENTKNSVRQNTPACQTGQNFFDSR